jgi:hypothetical protein
VLLTSAQTSVESLSNRAAYTEVAKRLDAPDEIYPVEVPSVSLIGDIRVTVDPEGDPVRGDLERNFQREPFHDLHLTLTYEVAGLKRFPYPAARSTRRNPFPTLRPGSDSLMLIATVPHPPVIEACTFGDDALPTAKSGLAEQTWGEHFHVRRVNVPYMSRFWGISSRPIKQNGTRTVEIKWIVTAEDVARGRSIAGHCVVDVYGTGRISAPFRIPLAQVEVSGIRRSGR